MATFTVTTLDASGAGSLREAITLANNNAGADIIVFAPGLSGGAIDISSGGTLGIDGVLTITDALKIIGDIDGDGSADITLDGNSGSQIMYATAALELEGLSFVEGLGVQGGAIQTISTLTVINSSFSENYGWQGGAIHTTSTLTVDNSSFDGNSAWRGGAIRAWSGDVDIQNSDFSGNSSTEHGGAIYSSSGVTVSESSFVGNSSTQHGGGIYSLADVVISGSSFEDNTAGNQASAVLGPTVTISSSSFENNATTNGAVVYATAIGASVLEITSSTFANNSSASGPGAAAANGDMLVSNSTFYSNTATEGAAAVSYNGTLYLVDVTAIANVGTSTVFQAGLGLSVTNSIILGNTGTTFDGSVTYSGLNIVNIGSDTDASDGLINATSVGAVFVTSAGVAVLADNGGPVKTVALNPTTSNPAIDGGGLATDARGESAFDIPDLGSAAGDLGAYEHVGVSASSVDAASADGTYWLGQTVDITVKFSLAVAVTGTPTLLLETGTTDREAIYVSGSGTDTLTFRYTVQAGDTAADLNFASTSALALNGGAILDLHTFAAITTLPATGSSQSLAAQASIQVQGIPAPAAPVLANPIADQTAAEDAALNFVVPSSTFTDANGDALTYSATLANGGALPAWLSFNAATRIFSGTPLNGHVGAITVKVITSDGTGSVSDEFVITVVNTNDAPTAITLSASSVTEHAGAGTLVGVISVEDPDVGDTAALSLLDSAGGRFALSGNQLVVARSAVLDYEKETSHTVTVRATDAAGATFDQTLTIDLVDIVEIIGGKGRNVLKGGTGGDRIDGKAGNDRLTGGDGGDTFVLGKGYGRDVITDFDPSEGDVIDLSGAVGIRNFRDLVRNHAEDTGRNLVITADDGSVLVLRNMDAEDLGRDMFVF